MLLIFFFSLFSYQQTCECPCPLYPFFYPHAAPLLHFHRSLHIHASSFGHKVLEQSDDGLTLRYSSPEADIGRDSNLAMNYYGFTLYNISCQNPSLNIAPPYFLSIEKASRHDALTTISATAQFSALNSRLHPRYMF